MVKGEGSRKSSESDELCCPSFRIFSIKWLRWLFKDWWNFFVENPAILVHFHNGKIPLRKGEKKRGERREREGKSFLNQIVLVIKIFQRKGCNHLFSLSSYFTHFPFSFYILLSIFHQLFFLSLSLIIFYSLHKSLALSSFASKSSFQFVVHARHSFLQFKIINIPSLSLSSNIFFLLILSPSLFR